MAHTHKLIDGVRIELTQEEKNEIASKEAAWNDGAFNRAMANLRQDRNRKLAETDYLALSDNTLSTEMANYRTQLRDITEGLTTVEEVNAVVFPTKPA